MAWFAALASANPQCAGIRVEVVDCHRGQLTIPAASQQRASDKRAEIGLAGIRQPAGFVVR